MQTIGFGGGVGMIIDTVSRVWLSCVLLFNCFTTTLPCFNSDERNKLICHTPAVMTARTSDESNALLSFCMEMGFGCVRSEPGERCQSLLHSPFKILVSVFVYGAVWAHESPARNRLT
jgi:hypothetical protein